MSKYLRKINKWGTDVSLRVLRPHVLRHNFGFFWSPICSPIWSPIGATFGAALALCEIYVSVAIPSFPSPNSFRKRGVQRTVTFQVCQIQVSGNTHFQQLAPLRHSARFPDPTFSKKIQIFENTTIGPKLSQKSIWQGPVAPFRVLSCFRKIAPARLPPADPFAKEGRHMRSRFCTLPDLRLRECSFPLICSHSGAPGKILKD